MKEKISLFLFIDAFGWEVKKRHPEFLHDLIKDSKPLETQTRTISEYVREYSSKHFNIESATVRRFFGDNGGRAVKRKLSRIRNIVQPPIEYIADPELSPDKLKVKARGKIGWTVIASRIITYPNGEQKPKKKTQSLSLDRRA